MAMKEGIQDGLKNAVLKRSGCYFLTLLKWVELDCGKDFSQADIERIFAEAVSRKFADAHNAFVRDPVGIANIAAGGNRYASLRRDIREKPAGLSIVALTRPQGDTHFILSLEGGGTWDSLPPERAAAKTWKPGSYRVLLPQAAA